MYLMPTLSQFLLYAINSHSACKFIEYLAMWALCLGLFGIKIEMSSAVDTSNTHQLYTLHRASAYFQKLIICKLSCRHIDHLLVVHCFYPPHNIYLFIRGIDKNVKNPIIYLFGSIFSGNPAEYYDISHSISAKSVSSVDSAGNFACGIQSGDRSSVFGNNLSI